MPFCHDYLKEVCSEVQVTFLDKTSPSDPGFSLTLRKKMNYKQFASAAAQRLGVDPNSLKFFFHDKTAIGCNCPLTLMQILIANNSLFYLKFSTPVHDTCHSLMKGCIFL